MIVVALLAACSSVPCKPETIFISYELDAGAAQANAIDVILSIGNAAPRTKSISRKAGDESIEVDFGTYPTGQTLQLTLVARAGSDVLASASRRIVASPGCTAFALSLAVTSGDLGVAGDLNGAPPGADLSIESPVDGASGATDMGGPFLSVSAAVPMLPVNLTTEGNVDWAHWGFALASDFDHKATGNGQISNYTLLGSSQGVFQFSDSSIAYEWTDGLGGTGQHATSSGATQTGIYVAGKGGGLSMTLPASATARHARIYVGGDQATGEMVLRLSDDSASPYQDKSFGSTNGEFSVVYDVHYRAATSSQLVVSWTDYDGAAFGNVNLQSATLLSP
jgi:hypothetical protein